MPSPIAHISAAWVISSFFRNHVAKVTRAFSDRRMLLFLVCVFFSLLPDVDAVPGVLSGEMGRFHNQWTHSILWAFVLSAVIAFIARCRRKGGFGDWFTLIFSCYGIHILMDYFTYGRGVRLFWPFTATRYKFNPPFFGGFHWSEGLFSRSHITTAVEEISFGAILIGSYCVIELLWRGFSKNSDAALEDKTRERG